ncbi:MAG: hypothetical protein Q7K35_01485, partial [bacterium]|nr:hypothetical protein [bacterium]
QSCRLYPQSDSLACDYYEDSGKRQKGWPGYCLEYDRRPGDPNTCLLWYPVDKVKGDGIEEGAGYLGKIPVFYCTEATAEKKYEYRHAYPIMSPSFGNFGACQAGYRNTGEQIACGNWRSGGACNSGAEYVCVPTGKAIALDGSKKSFKEDFDENDDLPIPNVNSPTDGWYDYNGLMAFPFGSLEVVISSANNKYARLICNSAKAQNAAVSVSLGCDDPAKACSCVLTKELYRSTAYCSKVVQTVTSMGQNKYWSSRVYKGSNYSVPNPLAYKYETDAAPFGSMVPPSSNPYDWDSDPVKDGVQPIYYSTDKTRIRSGEGYGCIYSPSNLGNASNCNFLVDDSSNDNFPYTYVRALSPTAPAMDLIKRLFAQSYGIWKWSTAEARTDKCKDSSVAGVNGSLCDLSNNDCIGGACTGSATKNVCSLDNSVNCITKAVEVDECKPAKGLESRCENDPDGDKCCAALQSATAKTNCSVCKKDSKGWYRCGGLNNGNLCCPGGQACYVCKDQTIIPKEGLSDDHCGDLGRAKCTLTEINRDYYSWNGADNYAKRCCNGEANPAPDISKEGTCISTQIKTCIGGESNGEFCAAHDCPGGKCETVTSTLPSRYVNDDSVSNWGPPVQVCKDTNSVTMITRSSVATDYLNSEDYCAIPPFVSNIKVNSIITNVELTKNGFINLTFNTKVDSNQLPMVMYGIDWGDNTKTVVTGVEMRDKPNTNLPESVYHLYSYWDLKAKFNQQCPGLGGSCNYNSFTCQGGTKAGQSCIDCTTSGQCKVKPKIQIKDNWGWCNNSATINGCSTATWESFDHWVVVKEK